MASTFPQAQEQRSFGSFLQKRTFFLPKSLISPDFSFLHVSIFRLYAHPQAERQIVHRQNRGVVTTTRHGIDQRGRNTPEILNWKRGKAA
jgi:hypothetical protein